MNYYTAYLKRALLIVIASLFVSCAMSPEGGILISPGELVNLKRGRSVRAPEGKNWRVKTNGVKTNDAREEIRFERSQDGGKYTFILIASGYAEYSSISQTEDQAAALFLNTEEKTMRTRGSTRSYFLKDLSREKTIIGGKILHVMKYTISDHSHVPMEIKYAMYLYFPNYTKQPRTYYIFLIGDDLKIKNTLYDTDLTVINKVIDSFETK